MNSMRRKEVRTNERTKEHMHIQTERWKLYTPRHKCRGYKECDWMSKKYWKSLFAQYRSYNVSIFWWNKCSRLGKSSKNQCGWQETFQSFNSIPWIVNSRDVNAFCEIKLLNSNSWTSICGLHEFQYKKFDVLRRHQTPSCKFVI